jgi:hypothetical protein
MLKIAVATNGWVIVTDNKCTKALDVLFQWLFLLAINEKA